MSDWTDGYMAEVDYLFGYFNELNPQWMRLPFLEDGLVFPEVATACELGFGQGVSTVVHAAATGVQWYGTDFSPAQAGFAQEMARASGASASMYDQAFADFCNRADLPDFDFIGLHGIWSWVSDDNRKTIVDFLRRKLKVGGVVYISYNVQAGWTGMAPVRHLMNEHRSMMSAQGHGVVSQVEAALKFAERLLASDSAFAKANPSVLPHLAKLAALDPHYLAHEYFNREWRPMAFTQVAHLLSDAKLSYAGSANYLDHIDALNLTAEQRALLHEQKDTAFRELVRDLLTNQKFRRDYWIKGGRRLGATATMELVRATAVALCGHRSQIPMKVKGALGEAALSENIYGPVLDAVASKPQITLGEVEKMVTHQGITLPQVAQAAMVLVSSGSLLVCQNTERASAVTAQTQKLNTYICERARDSAEIGYLASPVTGGGVPVGRSTQLFLLATAKGDKKPEELAQSAWRFIGGQGGKLVRDGKALQTAEENMAELVSRARDYTEKQLPILKNLGIA